MFCLFSGLLDIRVLSAAQKGHYTPTFLFIGKAVVLCLICLNAGGEAVLFWDT